jgi:hypothetical protein
VADELGTAVLRIVADDSAARESLNVLRRDVEQLTTRATRAASRTTQAAPRTGGAGGGGGTAPGDITRQDVRRFNLRGLNAALDDVNQDIAALRVGRRLNISSSWNKFLTQLEETQRDIERAAQTEGRRIGRLNVSPVRGGAAFPGSPAFLDRALPSLPASYFSGLKRRATQQSKRQADIVSNALIGGAFPLLFGQGSRSSSWRCRRWRCRRSAGRPVRLWPVARRHRNRQSAGRGCHKGAGSRGSTQRPDKQFCGPAGAEPALI